MLLRKGELFINKVNILNSMNGFQVNAGIHSDPYKYLEENLYSDQKFKVIFKQKSVKKHQQTK